MKSQQSTTPIATRPTTTHLLCLFVVACLAATGNAFSVAPSSLSRHATHLRSDATPDAAPEAAAAPEAPAAVPEAAPAAPAVPEAAGPTAVASASTTEGGATPEAPAAPEVPDGSYVRCGRCQTSFQMTEADLGGGKGRRLECSVCSHSWFQSKERIMTIKDGFEMIARPQYELDRVQLNLKENKAPNFMGDAKLYVGNIAFECADQDIYDVFAEIGVVGDVALVRDDFGKHRGFGFVTMRNKSDGEKCISDLDGAEVKGRQIAVRPSNN